MTQVRPLSRAPITEAVVDLRVKARADLEVSTLATVKESLMSNYPQMRAMRGYEARFGLSESEGPKSTTRELGLRGYVFQSDETQSMAQFRIDGFSFNKLAPYSSWEVVRPEALRLWQMYREVANPSYVTRIALRYINRLDVPANLGDFGELMTAPLPLPNALPQHVSRFLTRITIHDPPSNLAAHVSQVFDQEPGKPGGTLILDIDAFVTGEFPSNRQGKIDETLENLHSFKNRIFFESLTEEAIGRFV